MRAARTAESLLLRAFQLSVTWRYAIAVVLVGLALLLKLWLGPAFPPFITFFLAVPIVAALCGLWPGVLTIALSTALAWHFFISNGRPFTLPGSSQAGLLLTFIVIALIQALSFHWLRRALGHLDAARNHYSRVIDLIQEANIPMRWANQEVHPFQRTIGAAADCDLLSAVREKWIELLPLVTPLSLPAQAKALETTSPPITIQIAWDGDWADGDRSGPALSSVAPYPP